MLGLKLKTDPRWVTIVESNIEEILTDHAWCEQKAATNVITIITYNSEHVDLVTELLEIAKEELEHFQMVHNIIKERGLVLGRERKDHYVNELLQFVNNLTTEQFQKIQGFFETMPKLKYDVHYNCPVCNKAHTVRLEGMDSFF